MLFDDVNHSWMFSSNQIVETPPSLNLSFSYSSRLIFASNEWSKVRFCQKNWENSPLECRRSFSKLQNEKPLNRRSIGFQKLCEVRLCVFLILFRPVSLDYNLEC